MPEGDTIFRTAQTLDRALGRQVVTRFASVLPALTRVDEDAPIAGRIVERVWSQGKHLLIGFSGGLVLRTHMRMNGSWHVYRPGERWRRPRPFARIVIETATFVAVAFHVPVAEFHAVRDLERGRVLGELGPDLLAETFDVESALHRLRERAHVAVGDALLDQRAVAGIGNVYKSEVLFACGINPFTSVERLADRDLRRLVETARRLLQSNVAAGTDAGIATYPLRRIIGRAHPGARLWVYGRAGRACRRCGAAIHRRKQGADARSTYWCPSCQKDKF